MLDFRHANAITLLWEKIESKAALPMPEEDFFAVSGPMPVSDGCQRAFERYYMRCKAIAQQGLHTHAVYVQDCSRMGLGIVSPVQLFPRDTIEVSVDNQQNYRLEIKRCRRRGSQCYVCGTVFVLK